MEYVVACPNCYRGQPWDGELADVACRRCGRPIPVAGMARALVHLFSTAAFDPPHDALEDEDGDELLQWLVGRVWGDAMRVGRHDWVYAGCPVTVKELCTRIQSLDGAAFDSLGRLLSAGTPPEVLARSTESIASAAVARLERIASGGVAPLEDVGRIALRERLYDILSRFPSGRAVGLLEQMQGVYPTMDGDPERPIGGALAQAIERCRGAAAKPPWDEP